MEIKLSQNTAILHVMKASKISYGSTLPLKYNLTKCNDYSIASYYRQLSADIKIKNYRLKPVLLTPRCRRHVLMKLILILNFYFNIRRKLSL